MSSRRGEGKVKRIIAVGVLLVVAVGAVGCATERPVPEIQESAVEVSATPTLTTRYLTTVVDRGEAELCVGGVLQSNPPGCMGAVTLIGWNWSAVPTYEQRDGVRWGDYVVTGTYDPQTNELTVASVDSDAASPHSDQSPMGPPMPTVCPEPLGGWQILDESRADQESLYAVGPVAMSLDGYATMWLDRTPLPAVPGDADALEQMHHYAVNAGLNIVTVAVRGDPLAAEQRIRDVWGGALCVIAVDYTEAERQSAQQEIMVEYEEWGIIASGVDGITGVIGITVVHDLDGALQRVLDERYGAGLVVVDSALAPV